MSPARKKASPKGGAPSAPGAAAGFSFEDPQFTPDDYKSFSEADRMADSKIWVKHPPLEPIPPLQKDPPVMDLSEVLSRQRMTQYGKSMVFHAVGDTGGIKEPAHQFLVADKMVEDFHQAGAAAPAFFYHLGDVVYYFGQERYYYDQFYDPYRNYPGPIFAIPGNHDAVVYPHEPVKFSLEPFCKHFCAPAPTHADEAVGTARTTLTQPGVYFTLNAPLVKIIGLYSNTLEGSGWGVIADKKVVGQTQKQFLTDQLTQAAEERKAGNRRAVIVAVHHPPFTGSEDHNPSPDMLEDIDQACDQAKFVPDAFLSGHAHLYERFTRYLKDPDGQVRQTPFVVAGTGGFYNLSGLKKRFGAPPPRAPRASKDRRGNRVVEEHYFDKTFGFLRLTVSAQALSCEFVAVTDAATPGQTRDRFTLDLATHKLTGFHH